MAERCVLNQGTKTKKVYASFIELNFIVYRWLQKISKNVSHGNFLLLAGILLGYNNKMKDHRFFSPTNYRLKIAFTTTLSDSYTVLHC